MKLLVLIIMSFNVALAAPIVDCKDAAGYYGNLEVRRVGSVIKIKAEQGFAPQINKALNLSQEIFRYDIGINSRDCTLSADALVCNAGTGSILATAFGPTGRNVTIPFSGIVQLSVKSSGDLDEVELAVSLDHRIAYAQHSFGQFQGEGCHFTSKK